MICKSKSILLLLCLVPLIAFAQHTMERVWIQVHINHDGSAHVKEIRVARMNESGTEGYITFNNMGDMELRDISVRDDHGYDYFVESNWDENRSREEKEGRCGYHYTDEGVELCWGIGDAGRRMYEISYTLTNLVKAYDDYDGFCYSFYEAANTPPGAAQVDIFIEGDSLNTDKARIWAFGFNGYKGFSNGSASVMSNGQMSDGDAIIILLQLEKGLLQPVSQQGGSFAETVKREALAGSSYNPEDAGLETQQTSQTGGENKNGGGTAFMSGDDEYMEDDYTKFGVLLFFGLFLYKIVKEKLRSRKERKRVSALLAEKMGGSKYEDIPYWRQLPLGGNLLLSGGTLSAVDSMMRRSSMRNLGIKFGLQQLYDAFILRMIYKKNITIIYSSDERGNQQKLFRINKPVVPQQEEDVTDRYDDGVQMMSTYGMRNEAIGEETYQHAAMKYRGYMNDRGVEYLIQNLLYEAAGEDHLLQPDELRCYVEANPLEWRQFAVMLNRLVTGVVNEESLSASDTQQVVGFLRYLRDFSLVGERNIEEVSLWKEYLVFASFYGIADKVRKDMKKVAPDAARLDELIPPVEQIEAFEPLCSALNTTMLYAYAYQTEIERQMIEARHREQERISSSGGDGWSSFGGGGGHSGGGGSGFR